MRCSLKKKYIRDMSNGFHALGHFKEVNTNYFMRGLHTLNDLLLNESYTRVIKNGSAIHPWVDRRSYL